MLSLLVSWDSFSILGSTAKFDLEFLGEAKGDFPGGALRIRGLILERLGSGGGAKLLPRRRGPLPLEE